MSVDSNQNSENRRLDSWQEVASFFGRDERTVKRGEKERGLPIHRVPGGGRGSIFAYSKELTDWLRSDQLRELPDSPMTTVAPTGSLLKQPNPTFRRAWRGWGLAFGLGFLLLFIFGFTHFYEFHSVHG